MNPYLSPHDLLQQQPYDFVVVELAFSGSQRGDATLSASLVSAADGSDIGRYVDAEELKALWTLWPDSDEKMAKREAVVDRSYFPANGTRINGPRKFWIVLRAHHPLPAGAVARVAAFLDGSAIARFEKALP